MTSGATGVGSAGGGVASKDAGPGIVTGAVPAMEPVAAVIVACPFPAACTTPAESTVATDGSLDSHVKETSATR